MLSIMFCIHIRDKNDLDNWIGQYYYSETYPHNSGEIFYFIEYTITIYKEENKYYAKIVGDGWQTMIRMLAQVTGDRDKIEITYLQWLPDSMHLRFDRGEALWRFEREGSDINTVWLAGKIFFESFANMDGEIIRKSFEKVVPTESETLMKEPELSVCNDTPSPVPSGGNIPLEGTQMDVSVNTPAPFQAVPAIPDAACFTYEELEDGTLRITGYDGYKDTGNPYQVIIPATLDGKPVSTLGSGSMQACNLIELVISDGITTLESGIFDSCWEPRLVVLPDSVIHIDEEAFYPVAIACESEASYAYKYAMENGFACQVVNPVTEENLFLRDYAVSSHTSTPYLCHIRVEGELHDYIVIEYLDIAQELKHCVDSHNPHSYFQTSIIWDSNEFAVLVLDKESGAVLQCIDSYSFYDHSETISLDHLEYTYCNDILSIADWNFDGFLDLCLYEGIYGTGAVSFDAIFLYDKDSGLYTHAHNFPSRNIRLRTDKQCIESSDRNGPADHSVERYQYVDGVITHVATLRIYEIWEDGSTVTGVRDERLIDGQWQVYREETVILKDDSSDDAFEAADEQLTYLYVDDGYWDL